MLALTPIFAQITFVRDSIKLNKVCINSICIGDSLEIMYKVLHKPDSITSENITIDEDHPEKLGTFNTYLFESKQKLNFLEIKEYASFSGKRVNQADRIFLFTAYNNKNLFFGSQTKVFIGSDLNIIKDLYPNSYKEAIIKQELFYKASVARYNSNKQKFQSIQNQSKYKNDISYKIKIDREYKTLLIDPQISHNPKNISIYLKIIENEFNYYNRLSFNYLNGKLYSIFLANDY